MRVEAYFELVLSLIEDCPVVLLSNVAFEKRGTYEGYVQGNLTFTDGSVLHLREYVDVEISADRLMYVYQYVRDDSTLIFRYDNTGHHRKLNLSNYPHHRHDGQKNIVVASSAPTLAEVLDEIQRSIVIT